MTRDDLKWIFGTLGGVLVALAGHLDLFPWLSPTTQHYVELAGFMVGVASAKLSRSPLAPFDGGDDRVSGSALESVRKIGPVLLLAAVMGASACAGRLAPPATVVTAPGRAAWTADQFVARLDEFSKVVKADTGTEPGNIKPSHAFLIIEWISGDAHGTPPTTGLVQIIQTTAGDGWKAAAKQGYETRIRPLLLQYPKLTPYLEMIDAVLGVV